MSPIEMSWAQLRKLINSGETLQASAAHERRGPGSRPLLLTDVTVPLHNEYNLAAAVVDNIQEGLMCWQICTNKWVKATFGTLNYKQHEHNDSNLDWSLVPLNRANSISTGSTFACVSWWGGSEECVVSSVGPNASTLHYRPQSIINLIIFY